VAPKRRHRDMQLLLVGGRLTLTEHLRIHLRLRSWQDLGSGRFLRSFLLLRFFFSGLRSGFLSGFF